MKSANRLINFKFSISIRVKYMSSVKELDGCYIYSSNLENAEYIDNYLPLFDTLVGLSTMLVVTYTRNDKKKQVDNVRFFACQNSRFQSILQINPTSSKSQKQARIYTCN